MAGQPGGSQGIEPVGCPGGLVGPGPSRGETKPATAAGGDQLSGGGEQPQAELLGFPAADLCGQSEHRHPGKEVKCEGDDLQPDPVLRGVVQGQVAQAGVAGASDAVLPARPPAVTQFEVGPSPKARLL